MYILSFVGPSLNRIFSSHTIYLLPCQCGIFTPWYVFSTLNLLGYDNLLRFETTDDSKWTYCSLSAHHKHLCTEMNNILLSVGPLSVIDVVNINKSKKLRRRKSSLVLCPGLTKDYNSHKMLFSYFYFEKKGQGTPSIGRFEVQYFTPSHRRLIIIAAMRWSFGPVAIACYP